MRSRRPLALIALLALALGGGAWSLADVGSAAPSKAAKKKKQQRARASAEDQQNVEAMLRAFRRARTDRDALTEAAENSPLIADGVVDTRTARRVPAPQGDAWLLRGSSKVCHLRNGFLNCIPTEMLKSLRFAPSVSWRGDDVFVEGIAADEVRAVQAVMADGRRIDAPAEGNVVHLQLSERPVAVRWTAAGRTHQLDVKGGR